MQSVWQGAWSASTYALMFSQDFSKGNRARGRLGVVTWHDFTWRGRGYIFLLPPHPPTWSCAYARLFLPTWSRGIGGVQHADFTWCMGAWPPPHPSIGSRTRATICQYNFNYHFNFKFKCQFKNFKHRSARGRVQNHINGISKCNYFFHTLYY